MPTPRKSLEDRLREKLNALPVSSTYGKTLNTLAEATGVHHETLSRFMRGEGGMTLKNAEKLMVFFGMRVVEKEKR